MKNSTNHGKLKLDKLQVAKIKNLKYIIGGGGTGEDEDYDQYKSDRPTCPAYNG